MAIYNNQIWFGNRNYMQWVTAPQINYDSSRAGKVYTAQYTNGGAYVRRSSTGSRHYNFSWNLKRRDEIRAIMDYADGVYGDENPIYFIDPFAADRNLLPQFWATPSLGGGDAPLLLGTGDFDRPVLTGTASNQLGLPSYTANYTFAAGKANPPVYIPIPPGYTLWAGAWGTATSDAAVKMILATGPTTYGTATVIPLTGVNSANWATAHIDGNNAQPGAFFQLVGSAGSTLALTGVMAQLLPTGVTPQPGRFISGQGHSGCSFNDNPVLTNYSAAIDRVGLSVDLIETEGWK